MGFIKTIIVAALLTALIVNFIFNPFGMRSYMPIMAVSLIVIICCMLYIWVRKG